MRPFIKFFVVLLAVVGIITIISVPQKKANSSNRTPVRDGDSEELLNQTLRNAAQQALDAINSTRTLTASHVLAGKGQHVFNNNLLKFHRKVLQDLLRDVGGYDEQLNNLLQDLVIPLSKAQREAIGDKMVVKFSPGEFYVDYNAVVYGEYVRQLRMAVVAYLKAHTSVYENERNSVQENFQRVQFIANQMVKHDVYVDPMACDRWLKKDQNKHAKQFNEIRGALMNMIQNILEVFKKVFEKIKGFRERNNWNRDSSDFK